MKKAQLILLLLLFFWQYPYSVVGQSTFDSVDEWMSNHLEDVGGRAVLLIYKDGKIVYSKSANDMNKKQRRQYKWLGKRMGLLESQATADFNPDTYLPIASCSKWLTAALFLTFVDQQKVALDDSIGRYLPEMTKHGKGHILLWQCLAHMTGIEESSLATGIREIRNSENMSQAVLNIATKNMEGTAGKSFHYGNTGLQLIAAVCEKLGGKPFENLFQERIVKPCEMQHTDFGNVTVPLAAGGAKSSASFLS